MNKFINLFLRTFMFVVGWICILCIKVGLVNAKEFDYE